MKIPTGIYNILIIGLLHVTLGSVHRAFKQSSNALHKIAPEIIPMILPLRGSGCREKEGLGFLYFVPERACKLLFAHKCHQFGFRILDFQNGNKKRPWIGFRPFNPSATSNYLNQNAPPEALLLLPLHEWHIYTKEVWEFSRP